MMPIENDYGRDPGECAHEWVLWNQENLPSREWVAWVIGFYFGSIEKAKRLWEGQWLVAVFNKLPSGEGEDEISISASIKEGVAMQPPEIPMQESS